jgi:hypothetical protein
VANTSDPTDSAIRSTARAFMLPPVAGIGEVIDIARGDVARKRFGFF